MLFDTSFRKDLSRSFGVALVVLGTIVLTSILVRTLSKTAGGRFDPADLMWVIGLASLSLLGLVLTLALFIAVVSAMGRPYRDSEMAVWMASGVPARRFLRPVLRMAWPVLLLSAVLQLWLAPWAEREAARLSEQYERRGDLSRVAPGQFQSSRDGSKVFFIDRHTESTPETQGLARNVFILSQQKDRESVTTAAQGEVQWEDEDRYLLLQSGQRNETRTEGGERAWARFEQYRVLADRQTTKALDELPPRAMSSLALWESGEARHTGHLTKRLGLVLAGLNLTLAGVGLAATNPRRPNNWGLVMALLSFVVYFSFTGLTEAWVAQGKVSAPLALGALHGGVFVLALALLWWRDESLALTTRLLPRRSAA
ncbi:lipopolysaccharide export system permease protein [Inhella inkyongensis]|uniref:Lipopolysaccharide export system permease protein LptF n=1 Tax=Inhella inkyongensis TaxID=392593 RepID=A0A840S2U0_9BURK|nr:LPS export ABC transporter permease LptF [Inhella inkyongensis]MBB5205517.1 lipopolysaccharide export system permease protein [Inhella inkyongensis]